MAELSGLVVIAGGKTAKAAGISKGMTGAGELREATTGQPVWLPQVMAVATPVAVRAESAETQRREQQERKAVQQQAGTSYREELAFYRKYTERLLRRYVQMTMEAGRVSSMMGREVLGGRASSYRIHGFDDAVIFRLDVEKCLKQLSLQEHEVIRRIAIQEFTHVETAELLRVSLRTVGTRYGRSLDRLTEILLGARLLEPLRGCRLGRR